MSGVVWTKFFWSDWETDPALRLCSLAAQGLWMRMLCIAASHDPTGYVAVAGRPLSVTDLARMTGASETEAVSLLGELDQNGVFSRDRHGRIYSRRMVKHARFAAEAKKNGKLGGNPNLRNVTGKVQGDNPQDKGCLKPQEPEAISHKEKDADASSSIASEKWTEEDERLFEEFWRAYPHAKGRSSKGKSRVVARSLAVGVRRRLSTAAGRFGTSREAREGFAPASERWLRDGRYADWLDEERLDGVLPFGRLEPASPWPSRLLGWERSQYWDMDWGPRPGRQGCLVPTKYLGRMAG